MHSLNLKASLESYSYFASRRRAAKFRAVAKKIWERDQYTCQFCGFQAREYQEVVNLNGNFRDNRKSNLQTACCFCAQCFFLESVGEGGYGGGTVIYLPEMTQGELDSLCHVLFCAMVNETTYKESAQAIYRTLRMRSNMVEEHLGEGVSHPAALGQLLIDHQAVKKDDPRPQQLLEHFRLLPSRGRFKKQIERWAASALAEMD